MQATSSATLLDGLQQLPFATIFGVRIFRSADYKPESWRSQPIQALVPDPMSIHKKRLDQLYPEQPFEPGMHTADEETAPTEVVTADSTQIEETPSSSLETDAATTVPFAAAANPSATIEPPQEVAEDFATEADTPATPSTFNSWLMSLRSNVDPYDRPKRLRSAVTYKEVDGDAPVDRDETVVTALDEAYDDAKYQMRIYDSILLDDDIASPKLAELLKSHGHHSLAEDMLKKIDTINSKKNRTFVDPNKE